MRTREQHENKRIEIMEKSFDCYCEQGLNNTNIKDLAAACGMTSANLYVYFNNLDELIVQSTEHCMTKVEDEFMSLAPKSAADIKRFLTEIPYWTAREHGKKYRFMYQVYTSPRYLEYGKEFFGGAERRYTEYAKLLSQSLGMPWQMIQPMIFTFVRASVHFALFEDEEYMKSQMEMLWQMCLLLNEKYN